MKKRMMAAAVMACGAMAVLADSRKDCAGVSCAANEKKAVATVAGSDGKTDADTLEVKTLEGVEVVSTRAGKQTPMAFSNMEKARIRELNLGKDLTQMLSMTPSVTMSSDAGTGIGYTGIRVRGTDPTRVNVTANGIPLNDAESSQLYWVNLGDFASSVESLQIQRGVGTSTNGAGAFGATVNMQTESIGQTPYAGLDFSGGSYGTHKETFRFSTGLMNGHWGVQGRLSNIGSDGYIDRASARLHSYFLQGGYFSDHTVVKLITFNGKERTYMAWDYASKTDMEKYGRTYNPAGAYTDKDGNTAYYKDQTDNYHQQHYQLIWNQHAGRNLSFNAALHYTHGNGYYEQYKTGQKLYKYLLTSSLGSRSDLVRRKMMENDFYGFVASANYRKDRLTANLGGGWNKYDGDHFGRVVWLRKFDGSINPDHRYYDNNAKKTDGNIYGKLTYELLPGLSGYADLQYRHVNYRMSGMSQEFDSSEQQIPFALDKSYDFFNPKLGALYRFLGRHTVYASYAIAHKEPVRNDFENMMAESNPVEPKAERLNDLELGYKYESGLLTAGVNLYHMAYDNQFVLTGAQDANGEMVARNIKDSYRMGVELMLGLRPFSGFLWEVNATWSKNRAKDMQLTVLDPDTWAESTVNVGTTHLAYSPDFILNNLLSYEYKGWKASLMSKYVGEQYMTNSDFRSYTDQEGKEVSAMLDRMFVSDLSLSYTFRWKGLKNATVGVTVYNLFNEQYESNGSCSMNFKQEGGIVKAFGNDSFWSWSTYSAQAPTHFLAHLSLTF